MAVTRLICAAGVRTVPEESRRNMLAAFQDGSVKREPDMVDVRSRVRMRSGIKRACASERASVSLGLRTCAPGRQKRRTDA